MDFVASSGCGSLIRRNALRDKDRESAGYYLAYVDEMLSQGYNLLDSFVRTRSWRHYPSLEAGDGLLAAAQIKVREKG